MGSETHFAQKLLSLLLHLWPFIEQDIVPDMGSRINCFGPLKLAKIASVSPAATRSSCSPRAAE
ncbi:MAG: hypothetical protein HC828_15635 [Blastochloris sp.]|nr:hypothetical protein [Blastochloris sp.]